MDKRSQEVIEKSGLGYYKVTCVVYSGPNGYPLMQKCFKALKSTGFNAHALVKRTAESTPAPNSHMGITRPSRTYGSTHARGDDAQGVTNLPMTRVGLVGAGDTTRATTLQSPRPTKRLSNQLRNMRVAGWPGLCSPLLLCRTGDTRQGCRRNLSSENTTFKLQDRPSQYGAPEGVRAQPVQQDSSDAGEFCRAPAAYLRRIGECGHRNQRIR